MHLSLLECPKRLSAVLAASCAPADVSPADPGLIDISLADVRPAATSPAASGLLAARRSRVLRGFSLIELLIVMAIVAILASVAVPGYGAYRERAVATEGALTLQKFALLQERLRMARGSYQDASTLLSLASLPSRVADAYQLSVEVSDTGQFFEMTLSHHLQRPDATITLDSRGRRTPADVWP